MLHEQSGSARRNGFRGPLLSEPDIIPDACNPEGDGPGL
jgi:hypothetical protein